MVLRRGQVPGRGKRRRAGEPRVASAHVRVTAAGGVSARTTPFKSIRTFVFAIFFIYLFFFYPFSENLIT